MDSSGNVFVTGESVTVRDFISDPPDYATINYSNAGVPLWTNYYNGPANMSDQPSAIAVDSTGNVFVTGLSFDAPCCPVSTAYATIAYSKTGELLWENRCNGPDNVYSSPHSIAVDRAGNVFVTGYSWGSDDYAYYTTIKYSSAGATLWVRRFTFPSYDDALAGPLSVASNGNVFVTGTVHDPDSGTRDIATVAYSSSGVPLWTNLFNWQGDDEPRGIAVDNSGDVVVTGYRSSMDTNSSTDAATIAYSSAGAWLWTSVYTGPTGYCDQANAVAVDGNGNVFVTGSSGISGPTSTGYDFVTIKYSSVNPPPPSLSIRRTITNTVVVSWPSPSTGFVLQQNTNRLGTVNWSNVAATVQDNGTSRFIIVNPPGGNRFYRLVKP